MEQYDVLSGGEYASVVERRVAETDRLMGEATRARVLGELNRAIELLNRALGVMDGEGEEWPGTAIRGVVLALNSIEALSALSAIVDGIAQVEREGGEPDMPAAGRLDDFLSEQMVIEARRQQDVFRSLRPRMEADGTWNAVFWEMAQERARTMADNWERLSAGGVTAGPVSREERVRRTTRTGEKCGRPESRQERRARERAAANADRRSRLTLVR